VKVIDADAHVEECPTTWEFLDPEFRGRKPLPLTFPENTLDGIYSTFNAVWGPAIREKILSSNPARLYNLSI